MRTGPPDPSPPVEADFGGSHDAITAELLDLTWQFLTHAAPTVRAELGQLLADHGQHPSPASAPSSTAYSSAPHGTTHATHTASEHHQINEWGKHSLPQHTSAQRRWGQNAFPPGASSRSRKSQGPPLDTF